VASKRTGPDWNRIKAEYLKGGTSYRKLADKYGVSCRTIERRAKAEAWADECRQIDGEVSAEIHRQVVASRVLSAQEVLEEFSILARSDVRHYTVDDAGRLVIDASAPSDDVGRAVQSVKVKRTRRTGKDDEVFETVETEFKLWNKNQALQDLGKHLGLFGEQKGGENGNGSSTGNAAQPLPSVEEYRALGASELDRRISEALRAHRGGQP
jgi:hypothetical protein